MLSRIKSLFQTKKGDTFIGLIDEDGVGKSSFKNECSMSFTFLAYIKNDEALQEEEIVIHKTIPNFDYPTKDIEPLTIVELKGNQISYHGQKRINLISILKTNSSHSKLQDILKKRLKPVEFKSNSFGEFILDRRYNWFEIKTHWINKEIELFLSGDLNDINELESYAINLFKSQNEWDLKFRNKITEDLLSLKNEDWIDENEKPLTKEEFQQKITLENIIIHKEGDFEVWFGDGDTFWGHAIGLDGNLNGRLDEANIHG